MTRACRRWYVRLCCIGRAKSRRARCSKRPSSCTVISISIFQFHSFLTYTVYDSSNAPSADISSRKLRYFSSCAVVLTSGAAFTAGVETTRCRFGSGASLRRTRTLAGTKALSAVLFSARIVGVTVGAALLVNVDGSTGARGATARGAAKKPVFPEGRAGGGGRARGAYV